jgi:SM-20-related protein
MISYLNEQWKAADGGELLIHQLNNNQIITPTQQDRFF